MFRAPPLDHHRYLHRYFRYRIQKDIFQIFHLQFRSLRFSLQICCCALKLVVTTHYIFDVYKNVVCRIYLDGTPPPRNKPVISTWWRCIVMFCEHGEYYTSSNCTPRDTHLSILCLGLPLQRQNRLLPIAWPPMDSVFELCHRHEFSLLCVLLLQMWISCKETLVRKTSCTCYYGGLMQNYLTCLNPIQNLEGEVQLVPSTHSFAATRAGPSF